MSAEGSNNLPSSPPSKPETHEVSFRLWDAAILGVVSFACTMLVGAVVTLTLAEYSPETDFVFRFYGRFNPCVFFDHYPANLVTAMGVMIVNFSGISFALLLNALCFLKRSPFVAVATIGIAISLVPELTFINIFSSNLYEHHDEAKLNASTPFTSNDLAVVTAHTNWYLFYIMGSIVMCLVLLIGRKKFWSPCEVPMFVTPILLVSILLPGLQIYVNMFTISNYGTVDPEKSMLGTIFWWIVDTSGARSYSWVLMLVLRLMVPRQLAIHFSTRLPRARLSQTDTDDVEANSGAAVAPAGAEADADDHVSALAEVATEPLDVADSNVKELQGDQAAAAAEVPVTEPLRFSLRPSTLFTTAFRLLAFVTFISYVFRDPVIDSSDRVTLLALTSGFRVKPYAYLFCAAWVAIVVLFILGVYSTLVFERLSGVNSPARLMAQKVVGVALVLFSITALWVAIPNFDQSGITVVLVGLALPAWVLLCAGLTKSSIAWVVCWFAFLGLSRVHVVFELLLLVVLMLYHYIEREDMVVVDMTAVHVQKYVGRWGSGKVPTKSGSVAPSPL